MVDNFTFLLGKSLNTNKLFLKKINMLGGQN